MKPFFTEQETQSNTIRKTPLSCALCGRYKNTRTPKMKEYGEFNKGILIIDESPSEVDDRRGMPLQGRQGRMLLKVFKSFGIDLFKDALITHAVQCYKETKTPEDKEIACCRSKVLELIRIKKPNIIFLIGATPLNSIIGNVWKKGLGSILTWRGFQIPDRTYNAWVVPVFAPWFVEYSDSNLGNLAELIWKQDIEKGLQLINKKVPQDDEKRYCTIIESDKHFKSIFPILNKCSLLSYDHETTGLKPHAPGHKILTTSAAVSEKESYAWVNNPYRDMLFKKILRNNKIKKTAHNLQYEHTWDFVLLNIEVQGWEWCSMNAAHILDNRKGITGLKFQVYVNFGVADYDSHLSKYLESPKKEGANAFNTLEQYMKKYGAKEVLIYNNFDGLFGLKLTNKQMRIVKEVL